MGQDGVIVEAIHIRDEAAAEMKIFGSPICDEVLLVLGNTTDKEQLNGCVENPTTDKMREEGNLFLGEEMRLRGIEAYTFVVQRRKHLS